MSYLILFNVCDASGWVIWPKNITIYVIAIHNLNFFLFSQF